MSKLKQKFGRRILAYLLSGAMIMSNMTAFASETSSNAGGGYIYNQIEDTDAPESTTTSATDEEVEVKEDLESEENNANSDEKVASDETEAVENEQTSETKSSLRSEKEDAEKTHKSEDVRDGGAFPAGTTDFQSATISENTVVVGSETISGISVTNVSQGNGHGLTGNGGSIQLTLEKKANIKIESCQYNNGGSITTNPETTLKNGEAVGKDPTFIISNVAAGTFTLNLTGTVYIHNIDIEYINQLKISGSVTGTSDIQGEYSVIFKDANDSEASPISAVVSDGNYEVMLDEGKTYDISLSNADYNITSPSNKQITVGSSNSTLNITASKMDLVTVTGSITFPDSVAGPSDLALTFTEQDETNPHTDKAEIKKEEDVITYSVKLKKGKGYKVEASGTGIKEYVIDPEILEGKNSDAANVDFAFSLANKVDVTINITSYDNAFDVEQAKITFTDIEDTSYKYESTGVNNIKLRKGTYSVDIALAGLYKRENYADFTVSEESTSYNINLVERKDWDFTKRSEDPALTDINHDPKDDEAKAKVVQYNGLEISGGKFATRSGDVQVNTGATIKIPVSGTGEVKIVTYKDTYGYSMTAGAYGTAVEATNPSQSWKYTEDTEYMLLQVKTNLYLNEIHITRDEVQSGEYRYVWDFTKNESGEWTDISIENAMGKIPGGIQIDARNSGKFAYRGASNDVQVNSPVGLLVPVEGDSKITITMDNLSEENTYVVGEKRTAATSKTQTFTVKGDDITIGTTGDKYITITVTAGTIYLYKVEVEPIEEEIVNPSSSVPGKNVDGKPDVWDFAAGATKLDASGNPTEYIDSAKYNNMLTETLINSWFSVAAGSSSVTTSSFEVKNNEDKILLEFNGGGKANHRLRTKNTKITRYDSSSKQGEDGNEYLGYVYSNSSGKDLGADASTVYLGIMLEAGDALTAMVGSNGGASTIKFEPVDGTEDAQTFEYTVSDGVGVKTAKFYATKTGEYKLYSTNEKLVVARVTVEKRDYVKVSGMVTAPESLANAYSVAFKCKETGEVKTAKVTNGKYAIYLNEGYTYNVALDNANGYVVNNENPNFTLKGEIKDGEEEKSFTYDVGVESVDLVNVTGSVTGLEAVLGGDQNPLNALKLSFESDQIYVPELKLNRTNGTFILSLEKGITYNVVAEKVDDFSLVKATISASEDGTEDIAFTKKPVYDVTIIPEGVTKETLASTSFIFSRVGVENGVKVYDTDYVYTFTGTEGIQLRDGQYEISVGADCPYTMNTTSDLKVNGEAVEKVIKFDPTPKTSWDFTADAYTGQSEFGGLVITNGGKHGKQYGMKITNGSIEIPVPGACKIVVSVGYNWDVKCNEDTNPEHVYTDKTNSGDKDVLFEYSGDAGTITLVTGSEFTSYIKKIEVKSEANKAEYKEKITVGASGCDYTSINDALDAVRDMDRPNNERVTIEIQPGNYEEMLVVDTPNVTLKNANASPSIMPINKGVDIEDSSVRITAYYGHGYAYYSMGEDCKWNADILETNKENGCMSFENPGTGTTSGSYWNASVVINADGFEADGIIFENSFNQYVSKKAADDVIVPLSGAKEGSVPRASMQVGDTTVQDKKYVERAAALAITNSHQKISFNNCSFIGRQDTLYGGSDVTAAFYDCDIYGGTDYIFGPMTAVFAKCDLLFNTMEDNNDVGHITAAQTAKDTRGLLMYNCHVTSTTPGLNTASQKTSKPGTFGRPWAAGTGEAVFFHTVIDKADISWHEKFGTSLIQPVGWNSGLSGESVMSQEYGTYEVSGVDNSASRENWSSVLTAGADGSVTLADGKTVITDDTAVAAFFGDWNPFEGKDMTISTGNPDDPDKNKAKITFMNGDQVFFADEVEMTSVSGKYGFYDLSTVDTSTLTVPTGKKFVGWGTTADSKEIIETTRRIIVFSEGRTLYALFADEAANIYKVTFEGYDGEEVDTFTVLENANITFDGAWNDRDKYTFVGWKIKDGGADAKVYKENETYQVTGNVTFVETWEAKPLEKYTVILADETGKEIKKETIEEGTEFTLPDTTNKKDGYFFAGWKSDYDDRVYTAGSKCVIEGNVTFTETWVQPSKEKLTVKFRDENWNEIPELTKTIEAGENPVITLPESGTKKIGYTFVGWEDDYYWDTYKAGASYTVTRNVVFTEYWEEEYYEKGMYIRLSDEGTVYQGGAAVTPDMEVYYNGNELTLGTDYTVKYKNNKNAGTATLTVTGKNNFAGAIKKDVSFTIKPANIEGNIDDYAGAMTVIKNTKVSPILTYKGKQLKLNKDFTISGVGLDDKGRYTEVTGTDADGKVKSNILKITGINNYSGTLDDVSVTVIDKADAKSLAVEIDKQFKPFYGNALRWDDLFKGTQAEPTPKILVYEKGDKGKTPLTLGTDYTWAAMNDLDCVGTVKFIVVGMGKYSGTVTKSFKILPKPIDDKDIEISAKYYDETSGWGYKTDNLTAVYNSAGSTLDLRVRYKSGANSYTTMSSKNYKVSYSGNKKVGTGTAKITFINDYKGTKPKTVPFTITGASLNNTVAIAPDMVYAKAGKAYVSKPIVEYNGTIIKASEYTVSYAWASETEVKKGAAAVYTDGNKITLEEGDTFAKVKVTITPSAKSNFVLDKDAKGAPIQKTTYYHVRKADDTNALDLSKAKVEFFSDKDLQNQYKKIPYYGEEFYTPEGNKVSNIDDRDPAGAVYVKVTVNKTTVVDPSLYDVTWLNATNKGKATVVVTGKGPASPAADKSFAVGGKTANIAINSIGQWIEPSNPEETFRNFLKKIF